MEDIAYRPTTKINKSNANYIPIKQIPPYDDVGVSYKRYSKTMVSGEDWKLNIQETRHVSLKIESGAFMSTLFERPNWKTKTFYCTGIQFHWLLAGGIFANQFHVADVDEFGSAEIKLYEFAFTTGEQNIFLDLKDCPRKFSGKDFDLYTQGSLGSGDFVHVQLFGWEE